MKFLFFVLVLLAIAVCVVPVSAEYVITGGGNVFTFSKVLHEPNIDHFTYNADPDESIYSIEFEMPIGTTVNFTLNYGTVSTVNGYCVYQAAGLVGLSNSKIKLGADENTWSENFIDAQALGYSLLNHIQINSYAQNRSSDGTTQSGFALYEPGFGYWSNEIVFYPVLNIENNLINGISIVSSQPIRIRLDTVKTESLSKSVGKTVFEQIAEGWQSILDITSSVKDIIFSVFYWLKFIFVDNILLTMALYLSVTMAYSFSQSGSVFIKLKKFFRFQRSMIEFMINSVSTIVTVLRNLIPI